MKVKSSAPKEDPETAARRAVEETRAEADRTSATQSLLDRRTRRVLRIFGRAAGGGSGASGVIATPGMTFSSGGGGAGGGGGFGGSGASPGGGGTTFGGGRGFYSQFVN